MRIVSFKAYGSSPVRPTDKFLASSVRSSPQQMCSSAKLGLRRKAYMAQSCRNFRHNGGTLSTNVMHGFNSAVQKIFDIGPISQKTYVKTNQVEVNI